MYEAVRVPDWEQTFCSHMVADLVLEAIAHREAWSSHCCPFPSDEGGPPEELVVITFETDEVSREHMLLVTPIARQQAVKVLQQLGFRDAYLHRILLSKQLYHLRHGELSLWWLHALNQQFSQLLLAPPNEELAERSNAHE